VILRTVNMTATPTLILPVPLGAKQPKEAVHIQHFGKDECCNFCCRQKTNNGLSVSQIFSVLW